MAAKSKSLWVTFWPAWILANGIGWLLIAIVYLLPPGGIGLPIAMCFLLGLSQWIVLQKYIVEDYMWIGMSVPPYATFLLAILFLPIRIPDAGFVFTGIVCLGLFGLLQREALSYYLDNATTWVIASPLAGILAMRLSMAIATQLKGQSPALFWGLTGVLYGCLTGITLIILENSTIRSEQASILKTVDTFSQHP